MTSAPLLPSHSYAWIQGVNTHFILKHRKHGIEDSECWHIYPSALLNGGDMGRVFSFFFRCFNYRAK